MSSEAKLPGRDRFQRLSRLFDALTDVETADHDGVIAELCADDERLAEDVRTLLDIDGSGDAEPYLGSVLAAEGAALRESLEHGRAIGPWRAIRRVGRTRWRESYFAERSLDDATLLAVAHLLRGGSPSDERLARFWHACSCVSALDAAGRTRLLGSGVTTDGAPYLATEIVEGETLLAWCARRRVPIRGRVELFTAVCDVLGRAHARGIAHGALRSSRVSICGSEPVVHDLGVEHIAASWRDGDVPSALGDVRALGLALFELVTGRSLEAENPATVPTPSRIVIDPEARLELEGDLDAVLSRALRPASRGPYPDASALGGELRRWLGGLPVLVDFRPGEVRRSRAVRESQATRR